MELLSFNITPAFLDILVFNRLMCCLQLSFESIMTPKNRSCSLFTSCCPSILIFISSGDLLVNIIYLVLPTLSLRPLFLTHVCMVSKTLFARKFSSVYVSAVHACIQSTPVYSIHDCIVYTVHACIQSIPCKNRLDQNTI